MIYTSIISFLLSFSTSKLKVYGFWIIIFFTFTLLNFQSALGQISDSVQIDNNLHHTSANKIIVKIEYSIDGNLVQNPEKQSQLQQASQISVGNQFSRFAVQQSVIRLYALQVYSQIDVYTTEASEGIELKYALQNVIRINNINITGKMSDEVRGIISRAIKLKPGDIYTSTIANKDTNTIKEICTEYGYFSVKVETSAEIQQGIITYHIDLGVPTYVKDLKILGNTTVFTESILDICEKHVGRVYVKTVINKSVSDVRELYRKKYYPDTKIFTSFDHETGLLSFTIDEGIQLLLDFVDDKGRPIFRELIFFKLLRILRNRRVESEKDQLRKKIIRFINDDTLWVQIVESHFRAKGYHGTEVKSQQITNSPRHIKFITKLGLRYVVNKVDFTGNTAFSNDELLREMESKPANFFSYTFFRRFFSEQTLEKDIQRLKLFYEKAGYPNLSIKQELVKKDRNNSRLGEVSIKLKILEPHKEVIFRCIFSGNTVLNSDELLEILPNKLPMPNARLLKKDYENAILKAYQELGYIEAKIISTEYIQKPVKPIIVVEGNYTKLLDAGMFPKILRDAFTKAKLQLSDIATGIGSEWSMQDFFGNARYTLKQELNQLEVYAHGILKTEIEEGDRLEFGNFYFIGDTDVKSFVLNREVSHLSGKLFSIDKLNEAIQNINNMGIFQTGTRWEKYQQPNIGNNPQANDIENLQINSVPLTRTDDVEIQLQKRKPGVYGASLGYSSSDGPRGTIALSHRNLFKRNMLLRLRGRWGTLGYLYDTTLTEPWLISRTSGSVQFLGRKLEEDDDVRALQGSLSLSRKLSSAHRLNLQYSYRYLTDTSKDILSPKPSTTVSSLTFLWRQDTRFPTLNPSRGMLNQLTVEYAGRFLGGESSFIKTVTDTSFHKQLTNFGLVFATALRMGVTTGLQTESGSELISFERFWAGGSTTVRGYEDRGLGPEDSTGKHRGNLQFIFNSELRFPIFDPIRGIIFFDSGNVWDSVEDIQYEWLPSSVGVGIRLHLGPLIGGLDYAFPLVTVAEVPLNSIYFRVGNTF